MEKGQHESQEVAQEGNPHKNGKKEKTLGEKPRKMSLQRKLATCHKMCSDLIVRNAQMNDTGTQEPRNRDSSPDNCTIPPQTRPKRVLKDQLSPPALRGKNYIAWYYYKKLFLR